MADNKKTITLNNNLLADIEMAMNDNGYEMEWYLDTVEEEIKLYCDPDLNGLYDEMEELEQQLEEDAEGRFMLVPPQTSREGWKQLEQFILSLDDQDETTKSLLLNTIQGRGAFQRFKDAMSEIGMLDRWYEHKNRQDRKEALDWLRSEDLITNQQVEEGLRMYDDLLHKRKRREMEIANMIAGRRVKCTDNTGHPDKLTPGKVYEVLDEQKQHLNIRIEDDRGKVCWLPKSHFELEI